MALVATGSTDALATLYDRFARRAYGMALTICRDEAQAEDAVQETFLSIWRNSASYEPQRGTVAAWLLTVVRYRALDMVRPLSVAVPASQGRTSSSWQRGHRCRGPSGSAA